MKGRNILRQSRQKRPAGLTDWVRLNRESDEEIERQAGEDPDTAPLLTDEWLARAQVIASSKKPISIRIDQDVLDFFRQGGRNYQTRINRVLRAYVEAHKKTA